MDLDKAASLIESEYQFLGSVRDRWSLTKGPQDMELAAHALRVILHMGKAGESLPEVQALIKNQHADGGWGRESQETESAAWVSAFCALMLIRGSAVLQHPEIEKSVFKCINYFLQGQKSDGRWVDSEWGDLDTTSHPVSFFNVVLAIGTQKMKEAVRSAWRKGLRFILEGQSEDGGWYDLKFHPSGVETTAHLGQDAVVASLALPEGLPVRPSAEKALNWILKHQDSDGSWDGKNVDHTMDCTRSALLISRMIRAEQRCRPALEKAMEWIMANKTHPNGWPDFPGEELNLERTCDGLDVLLKYQAWRQADPLEVVRRWGYVPGEPVRPEPAVLLRLGRSS
ncbi:MAG: terpene cyclase/mutase family protein [Candidatus Omnitrophica bacterium]|nr:terpene cyclase/mutase family protein [Candidatus Omnitrophota bacterium]